MNEFKIGTVQNTRPNNNQRLKLLLSIPLPKTLAIYNETIASSAVLLTKGTQL